jgi:hypothetical protein
LRRLVRWRRCRSAFVGSAFGRSCAILGVVPSTAWAMGDFLGLG